MRRWRRDTRKPAQAQPFGVAAAISAEGDAEGNPEFRYLGARDRTDEKYPHTQRLAFARRILL
jgi:hypothetical protein